VFDSGFNKMFCKEEKIIYKTRLLQTSLHYPSLKKISQLRECVIIWWANYQNSGDLHIALAHSSSLFIDKFSASYLIYHWQHRQSTSSLFVLAFLIIL